MTPVYPTPRPRRTCLRRTPRHEPPVPPGRRGHRQTTQPQCKTLSLRLVVRFPASATTAGTAPTSGVRDNLRPRRL